VFYPAEMNLQEVRTWFAYNHWANRRLLQAAGELPTEDFDRDVRASFGSIKGTLRHLLWGERGWLRHWTEGSFGPDLSATELPDLPSLVAEWARLEEAQDAFVRGLNEEKLREPRKVHEDSYVLRELLQHCLNHSTHHRGQVVLMLRQLGRTPPGTGFRQFLTESRRPA
jgi:uncharacterized damage-inducible protein DinB